MQEKTTINTEEQPNADNVSLMPLLGGTAKRIQKYFGCKIEITPSTKPIWYKKLTVEELEKEEIDFYNEWVKDFNNFLRDHRSQDVNDIQVIIDKRDVCSKCGKEWETYEDEGKTCCAYCGERVAVSS